MRRACTERASKPAGRRAIARAHAREKISESDSCRHSTHCTPSESRRRLIALPCLCTPVKNAHGANTKCDSPTWTCWQAGWRGSTGCSRCHTGPAARHTGTARDASALKAPARVVTSYEVAAQRRACRLWNQCIHSIVSQHEAESVRMCSTPAASAFLGLPLLKA